jgi:putative hemolysin
MPRSFRRHADDMHGTHHAARQRLPRLVHDDLIIRRSARSSSTARSPPPAAAQPVHADHRGGSAVMLMWSALVAFAAHNGLCAARLVDADCRVQPRLPLPVDDLNGSLDLPPPTLIRGYLACGARLLGPPCG